MPLDYPDGYGRNLSEDRVDLEYKTAHPYRYSLNATLIAGASGTVTHTFYDTENILIVDRIVVVPTANIEFTGYAYYNGDYFQGFTAVGMKEIDFKIACPRIIKEGESLSVYIKNNSAVTGYFNVYILGTRVKLPASYSRVPYASFLFQYSTIYRFGGMITYDYSKYSPVSYDWDYGDGSPHGSGSTTQHFYDTVGSYKVVQTVYGSKGFTKHGRWLTVVSPDALNMTIFTESDPDSKITVAADKVSSSGMLCNSDAFVGLDCGADYFDNFGVIAKCKIVSVSANGVYGFLFGISNHVGVLGDPTSYSLAVAACKLGDKYYIKLQFYDTVGVVAEDSFECSAGTDYYLLMRRMSGYDTAYLLVYSDASMTVLIDTLEVSDSAVSTKFRYLYAHSSLNTAAAESISLETGNVCVV